MDLRLSEEQAILRRTVREFAEAEIRPHVMEWDEAQQFPMDLLPKLAALGLTGIQFPEEYGGAGMSGVDYCICIEEIARVCPSIALSVAAHNGLCTSHISLFGNERAETAYLPRLVRGEVLGAWGLTEARRRQRRRGDAHHRGAAGRLLGAERSEDVHHARPHRRHHGRDGGDRSREGAPRHLRVRRRARHARA